MDRRRGRRNMRLAHVGCRRRGRSDHVQRAPGPAPSPQIPACARARTV